MDAPIPPRSWAEPAAASDRPAVRSRALRTLIRLLGGSGRLQAVRSGRAWSSNEKIFRPASASIEQGSVAPVRKFPTEVFCVQCKGFVHFSTLPAKSGPTSKPHDHAAAVRRATAVLPAFADGLLHTALPFSGWNSDSSDGGSLGSAASAYNGRLTDLHRVCRVEDLVWCAERPDLARRYFLFKNYTFILVATHRAGLLKAFLDILVDVFVVCLIRESRGMPNAEARKRLLHRARSRVEALCQSWAIEKLYGGAYGGQTLLHAAVRRSDVACTAVLLSFGCALGCTSVAGYRPMHDAIRRYASHDRYLERADITQHVDVFRLPDGSAPATKLSESSILKVLELLFIAEHTSLLQTDTAQGKQRRSSPSLAILRKTYMDMRLRSLAIRNGMTVVVGFLAQIGTSIDWTYGNIEPPADVTGLHHLAALDAGRSIREFAEREFRKNPGRMFRFAILSSRDGSLLERRTVCFSSASKITIQGLRSGLGISASAPMFVWNSVSERWVKLDYLNIHENLPFDNWLPLQLPGLSMNPQLHPPATIDDGNERALSASTVSQRLATLDFACASDPFRFTALHTAVMCGSYSATIALLEHGADPNIRAGDLAHAVPPLNLLPFARASDFMRVMLAMILVKHGADPRLVDSRGYTALALAPSIGVALALLGAGASPCMSVVGCQDVNDLSNLWPQARSEASGSSIATPNFGSELAKDLRELRSARILIDTHVRIIGVADTIKVHRCIVAARCPGLRELLRPHTTTSLGEISTITMPSTLFDSADAAVQFDACSLFFSYVYGADFPASVTDAVRHELLVLAERCDMANVATALSGLKEAIGAFEENIATLLNAGEFSDICVSVTDPSASEGYADLSADVELAQAPCARTFALHAVVLAARVPFFRQMFGGGSSDDDNRSWSENRTGLINLEMDNEAFNALLSYCYSGRLPNSLLEDVCNGDSTAASAAANLAIVLLGECDKMGLRNGLMRTCELVLITACDDDIVSTLWNIAQFHNATLLQTYCEFFVSVHLSGTNEGSVLEDMAPRLVRSIERLNLSLGDQESHDDAVPVDSL